MKQVARQGRRALDWLNPPSRRARWSSSGLDLELARRWGGRRALDWSSLCLSGSAGAAIQELAAQLAYRALNQGMGVVWVGASYDLVMVAAAQERGRLAFEFGEAALMGGPNKLGSSGHLSSAKDLALALDAGALAMDAWGWRGVMSSKMTGSAEVGGWERASGQLEKMTEACSLAMAPFVLILSLEALDKGMAPAFEALAEAIKTRAPKGSRLALALRHYGEADTHELPFGAQSWFDARWVGRLGTEFDGGPCGEKLMSLLGEQVGEERFEKLRKKTGPLGLSDLCEGEGYWLDGSEWVGSLSFPYIRNERWQSGQSAQWSCCRSFLAEAEREELARVTDSAPRAVKGEPDERSGKSRRL